MSKQFRKFKLTPEDLAKIPAEVQPKPKSSAQKTSTETSSDVVKKHPLDSVEQTEPKKIDSPDIQDTDKPPGLPVSDTINQTDSDSENIDDPGTDTVGEDLSDWYFPPSDYKWLHY